MTQQCETQRRSTRSVRALLSALSALALGFGCSEGAWVDPTPGIYPPAASLIDGAPAVPFADATECIGGYDADMGSETDENFRTCMCDNCLDVVNGCKDTLCDGVATCSLVTGCVGPDCYETETCKAEIDGAGITSPSLPAATEFRECRELHDCIAGQAFTTTEQCESEFDAAIGVTTSADYRACVCGACLEQSIECASTGCKDLAACQIEKDCTGLGCYAPSFCQTEIDLAGPNGPEHVAANDLRSCTLSAACALRRQSGCGTRRNDDH